MRFEIPKQRQTASSDQFRRIWRKAANFSMPFKSKAQQGFLEAHPDKIGGPSKLKEWESATNFKTLPENKSLAKSAKKVGLGR